MKKHPPLRIDFLAYQDQLKTLRKENKTYLWDPIRQKHLVLLPEEFVRQLVVLYLLEEKGFNKNRIGIEKGIKVNGLAKRCDLLVYNQLVEPILLVECKAPEVALNQSTFEQIARYNLPLQVDYLMVTNGRQTYCCKMDYKEESFEFLDEIPSLESTKSK